MNNMRDTYRKTQQIYHKVSYLNIKIVGLRG